MASGTWRPRPDFYDATSAHLRIKRALIWWKNCGGMGDCATSYAPDYEVLLHAAAPPGMPAWPGGDSSCDYS
ncbi:hypothetical protein BHS06_25445 [Myxococcus xanthus]|uniref:hypothetical protein n=1 Tax=Myxococcus xanthus TaxID=34 RepID=UPI0011629472|nr:hypothetical protein [Myxococcus xanthus]QDE92052.1 hypothetical protein BHS06_25445 [Myxococcus xanthus]